MGWSYKRNPIDDPVAYLTDRFNHEGKHRIGRVLDAARVGNTVYMAIRSTDQSTGRSFVFATIILISNTKRHGFGYKDMCEMMGPYECACPQRIMRLLSPVTDIPGPSYAADWRARVSAHHKAATALRAKRASLRPGSLVTLEHAVSFRDGITAAAFRLCFVRRGTPIFEPVDRPGFWCRLPATILAGAAVTPADATNIGRSPARDESGAEPRLFADP